MKYSRNEMCVDICIDGFNILMVMVNSRGGVGGIAIKLCLGKNEFLFLFVLINFSQYKYFKVKTCCCC